jgi:hypothetical protein
MRAKGTKIKQPQICPQPDSTTSRTYAKKASAVMATMDDTVDLTKSSDDERGQRGEEVPFDSRGDGRASIKAASLDEFGGPKSADASRQRQLWQRFGQRWAILP